METKQLLIEFVKGVDINVCKSWICPYCTRCIDGEYPDKEICKPNPKTTYCVDAYNAMIEDNSDTLNMKYY